MPEKSIWTKEVPRGVNPVFNAFVAFSELSKVQNCQRYLVRKREEGEEGEREREREQDTDRDRHREQERRAGNPGFRQAQDIAG